MLYLLDANVLITASRLYYPFDVVPEYWAWLQHMAESGHVKMPVEIFEEVKDGPKDEERDPLFAWIQSAQIKKMLVLDEDVEQRIVQDVVAKGYAADLSDDELEKVGRDPFLIAHGKAQPNRKIVTAEVSKPRLQRANRKVPVVCNGMGVPWCTPFEMNRELGFRTNWRTK